MKFLAQSGGLGFQQILNNTWVCINSINGKKKGHSTVISPSEREESALIWSLALLTGTTPQETEPDLPVTDQESPAEAWVGSGLLQGQALAPTVLGTRAC